MQYLYIFEYEFYITMVTNMYSLMKSVQSCVVISAWCTVDTGSLHHLRQRKILVSSLSLILTLLFTGVPVITMFPSPICIQEALGFLELDDGKILEAQLASS